MANLHKAIFDKSYHTQQEVLNLSNEELITKVREEEDSQVSMIYSVEEFNEYNKDGYFDDCYIFDVYL